MPSPVHGHVSSSILTGSFLHAVLPPVFSSLFSPLSLLFFKPALVLPKPPHFGHRASLKLCALGLLPAALVHHAAVFVMLRWLTWCWLGVCSTSALMSSRSPTNISHDGHNGRVRNPPQQWQAGARLLTTAPVDGDLRMGNPVTAWPVITGRVEVYYSQEWGTVCDDDFLIDDCNVACRQLGQGQCVAYDTGSYPEASSSVRIWLDDLRCQGHEATLDSCGHNGWGQHNCGHSEDVMVSCTCSTADCDAAPSPPGPPPGSVDYFSVSGDCELSRGGDCVVAELELDGDCEHTPNEPLPRGWVRGLTGLGLT